MAYYHGSPTSGLKELAPALSEHGKPYVYFSTNPLVALLYAVKPVPKPFSFYPYGFDKEGRVIYTEYYENAFADLYKGKAGSLYQCSHLPGLEQENPVAISCACVCAQPVEIQKEEIIPDLYQYYMEFVEKGLFVLRSKDAVSEKEMGYILGELKKDMETHRLKEEPQHPMSLFLQAHFPVLWQET